MTYAYFPGCSAAGTGRPYEESVLAVLGLLNIRLSAITEWNCCGATAYPATDAAKALALAARNLALAERRWPDAEPVDVVAACAGCYRALLKAEHALEGDGRAASQVRDSRRAVGVPYEHRSRTRHPLDVLVRDVGLPRIADVVVRPLTGLRVACYYGCLLVRPDTPFDDRRAPSSMERLFRAAGAEPIDWPLRTRCCGGSCYCGGPLVGGLPEATLTLSHQLLQDAAARGAEVLVTVCPLCQFNLEAFQGEMRRAFDTPAGLPVVFFTQLLGLALGLDRRALGLHRMLRQPLPERLVKG